MVLHSLDLRDVVALYVESVFILVRSEGFDGFLLKFLLRLIVI